MRKFAATTVVVLTLGLAISGCVHLPSPITEAQFAAHLKKSSVNMDPQFADCVAKLAYPKLNDADKRALSDDKGDKVVLDDITKQTDIAAAACKKKGLTP